MSSSRSETDILTKTVITLKEEINELRTKLQNCIEILANKQPEDLTDDDMLVLNKWRWSDNKYILTKNE